MGEQLANLFTELSNESRMAILFLLYEEKLNLTKISFKLDLSMPETSRHLSRLHSLKFIKKDVRGYYHLTRLGLATLKLLPGFEFIARNKDFILRHSFLSIPNELFNRIGELAGSIRVKGVMNVIELVENCINNAEIKIFIMAEKILQNNIRLIENRMNHGVTFSSILPESYILPIKLTNRTNATINNRTQKEIKNFILLTEKETVMAFPNKANITDYSDVLYSKDNLSLKWSTDLTEFFLEKIQSAKLFP